MNSVPNRSDLPTATLSPIELKSRREFVATVGGLFIGLIAPLNVLSGQSNYDTPYSISTFAGSGIRGGADGTGREAQFRNPVGLAVDSNGNIYVAESSDSTIRKISPTGVVSTLAGAAGVAGSADGPGSAARFNGPYGVAVDGAGNVYVADSSNYKIRKITPAGSVSTLAGSGAFGSADGTGTTASFSGPYGLAVDAAGTVFVADSVYNTIRKISPSGTVSTLAGSAGPGGSIDGVASAARFNNPVSVAVDPNGNVFVADRGNNTIRKITPSGVVSTLAGSAGQPGSADGLGATARFNRPFSVAADGAGNIFVGETNNATIRKITGAGVVTTVAGLAGVSGSADGVGNAARFSSLTCVAVDRAGTLWISDTGYYLIRRGTLGLPSQIVNLSILTSLDAPGDTFTLGFVIGGAFTTGVKELLFRAAGPALAAFGVGDPMADPKLQLFSGPVLVGENDNWAGAPALSSLITQVGAFAYTNTSSKDAAYAAASNLFTASSSVVVSGVGGATGTVIAEIYDATPEVANTVTTPRLINVSVLKNIPSGATLTAGFVIRGTTAKSVLVRAIGPTLLRFGVPDALADPQLRLFSGPTQIATNDNWGGVPALQAPVTAAFTAVGAFILAPNSLDAALLVTLEPGSYSVQASGVGGLAGTALVEVYEMP